MILLLSCYVISQYCQLLRCFLAAKWERRPSFCTLVTGIASTIPDARFGTPLWVESFTLRGRSRIHLLTVWWVMCDKLRCVTHGRLTHLPLVPHLCVSESDQHWFRKWIGAEYGIVESSYFLFCVWLIIYRCPNIDAGLNSACLWMRFLNANSGI